MSTSQNEETLNGPASLRDRLKAAFSNVTEEERRAYKSLEAVGKTAFLRVVRRIISTIGSVEDWLAHKEHSNPAWLTPMRELLEQAYQTDEAVTFLPQDRATSQVNAASGDPALELQKAFQRHLGEPFDHHSAFDHFDADSAEEISRLTLMKAVNRAITSIAAIEERLHCENSNPNWARHMRDFLEHAQYASSAVAGPVSTNHGPQQKQSG